MGKLLIVAVLVAGTLAVAAVIVAGGGPEPPPGARADGTLDPASLPALVGVVGPDGRDVVCANGERLTVRRAELLAAPVAPGETQVSEGRMLVPRCGPRGTTRWVVAGE